MGVPSRTGRRAGRLSLAAGLALAATFAHAADHNDPNAINSIFSDVPVNPADLYDLFGFPADDRSGGDKVVLALTFAAVPKTGVLDPDVLYRVRLDPSPRVARPAKDDWSLDAVLAYADTLKERFLDTRTAEVRVRVDAQQQAKVDFIGFPSGSFTKIVPTNTPVTVQTPDGQAVQVYVGGRDDAFFNDLPGFFRSINYGPQFYLIPQGADPDLREFAIPKTLLELEGNTLFNFDPAHPRLGQGEKLPLPAEGPRELQRVPYRKDASGHYRFVYSGKDAQAGRNVNAIILELPLAWVTAEPAKNRIVNAWGESWVLKAANKVETIPDEQKGFGPWLEKHLPQGERNAYERELDRYKRVDTDGVPFEDAALSEREDARQLGADNLSLARRFVIRFAHLGWGFGPSIDALGLKTCFDHGGSPVSIHRYDRLAIEAFPHVKTCLFQEVNMPDASWNPRGLPIPAKRTFEIFIPNVCGIDMDTTGTWPYGRRLEDQVATRFLSLFLDMKAGCGGQPCTVETLDSQALWDGAPIEPKTPPNPLHNDKPFLAHFPYLAEPW